MITDKELQDFYNSKGLPIGRLTEIGKKRYNLKPEPIKKAAREIYKEIKKGKQIKDIQIAWTIWNKAKFINIPKEDLKDIIELRKDNTLLRSKINFWRVLGLLTIFEFSILILTLYLMSN